MRISSLTAPSFFLYFLLILSGTVSSQQTVGLFYNHNALPGYVLFSPIGSTSTFLIDKCGKKVHEWQSAYRPGQAVYLLPDGNLLRTGDANNPSFSAGGSGGLIEKLDWNSNVLWRYFISDSNQCQHHDACPLPNGNVLAISWERKTKPQAVAQGRNPATTNVNFWSEKIIELEPLSSDSARIVWEWHVWDHLIQHFDSAKPNWAVVADHPELIHLNFSGTAANSDWLHINSVAYNPQLDQVMLSSHNFNEVWIIDHSTTTAEAASHSGGAHHKGGDLLYRWGNPQAYERGTNTERMLFGQHNAHWIEPGLPDENKIMIYNNGNGRPAGFYSTVEILMPPLDISGNYTLTAGQAYGPLSSTVVYQAPNPTDFYSSSISGAQRLPNGNTLICEGNKGNFFEADAAQNLVWKYVNPVNTLGILSQGAAATGVITFRCTQYQSDYPGLAGITLSAGSPIELNPLPDSCTMIISYAEEIPRADEKLLLYPNPTASMITGTWLNPGPDTKTLLSLLDKEGRLITQQHVPANTFSINVSLLPEGIYFLKLESDNSFEVRKVLVVR
jgi:hypothetical protein